MQLLRNIVVALVAAVASANVIGIDFGTSASRSSSPARRSRSSRTP